MIGYLMGGFLTYKMDAMGVTGAYLMLLVIHAACMAVTVHFIRETPIREVVSPYGIRPRCQSFIDVFRNKDFRIVFITRFLMQMGILTVQEYLQYYLDDAIGAPFVLLGVTVATTAEKAVSILFCPMLLGAIGSSLLSGIISDKLGGRRKLIVYITGAMMAVACMLFSLTRSYGVDMALALLFGLGFGGFSVMDWAMATDVLPNPDEFAKDMGIWSLALVLPQVIAAPISGFLLDYFQAVDAKHSLGYSVIFLVAVLYFAGGTFFVKYIGGVH